MPFPPTFTFIEDNEFTEGRDEGTGGRFRNSNTTNPYEEDTVVVETEDERREEDTGLKHPEKGQTGKKD